MGSFSIWHWLIVALVVLLVFGTKRLRGAGRDLGEAIKGFKKGINDDETPPRPLDDQTRSTESQRQQQHQNNDDTPR